MEERRSCIDTAVTGASHGSQRVHTMDPAGAGRCRRTPGLRSTTPLFALCLLNMNYPRGILAKRPKIWPLHAESSSKGCGGDSCHTGGSLGHILSVSGSPTSHVASGKLGTHETQCRPGGKSSHAESEVKAGLCATISVP